MSIELSRRAVVAGALAFAGGGAAAWWYRDVRRLERSRTAFLELARERDLIENGAELGRRYLSAYPDEADPELLLRLLFADAAPDHLGAALSERIGRDWIELETVQLDGWILARSEGRVLALGTLLSPDSS